MTVYFLCNGNHCYTDDNAVLHGELAEAVEVVPGGFVVYQSWGEFDAVAASIDAGRVYSVSVSPDHAQKLIYWIGRIRGHVVIAVHERPGSNTLIEAVFEAKAVSPSLVSESAGRIGGHFADLAFFWGHRAGGAFS